MWTSDSLKGVGVSTIGQRLAILKAVYLLKVAHKISIEPDTPCNRLNNLEEENRHMNQTLQLLVEDLNALQSYLGRAQMDDGNSGFRRQPSFKWAQYVRLRLKSPSPQQLEHDLSYWNRPSTSASTPPERARVTQLTDLPNLSSTPAPPKTTRTDSSETLKSFKSFKVRLDDPTWKVLPAALKKYRITNDNWENYAMFI
ncbi:hypothetical protein GGX14DRAFT_584064 [Mycena pura]|uniref:Ras-associating domain-containing protein n=1 Tax=Mycena pura TaxID=153505 RepID=A0AAD6YWA5_9AGAR|nr:hypothetical protein GGX14DRAFT_584064 [Mycena pura]